MKTIGNGSGAQILSRSGGADRTEKDSGGHRHPTLRGTADWIALCQSCASEQGSAKMLPRPALMLRAIINRLRLRDKP